MTRPRLPNRDAKTRRRAGNLPASSAVTSSAPPPNRPKRLYGRRRKSTSPHPNAVAVPSTTDINLPEDPHREHGAFTTRSTEDDLIHADAIYRSWSEWEEKFAAWKAKYQQPFRIASSEALRTEYGVVSQRFKYRYVVYHCSRFGAPRKRGEGKRPNQNYLPCNCTAMIRLNFNYQDQTMRVTSLETRHKNHAVSPQFFRQMRGSGRRNKKSRLELGEQHEHQEDDDEPEVPAPAPELAPEAAPAPAPAPDQSSSSAFNQVQIKNEPMAIAVTVKEEPIDTAEATTTTTPRTDVFSVNDYVTPFQPSPPPVAVGGGDAHLLPFNTSHNAFFNSELFGHNLHNQMMMTQMHLNAFTNQSYWPTTLPLTSSVDVIKPTRSPSLAPTSSRNTSPAISANGDENDEPPVVPSAGTTTTFRPVALRPSENSAFTRILTSFASASSLTPPLFASNSNSEVTQLLSKMQRLLLADDMAPETLQMRVQQLSSLLAAWNLEPGKK